MLEELYSLNFVEILTAVLIGVTTAVVTTLYLNSRTEKKLDKARKRSEETKGELYAKKQTTRPG